jgi:hypothetical protein
MIIPELNQLQPRFHELPPHVMARLVRATYRGTVLEQVARTSRAMTVGVTLRPVTPESAPSSG